MFTLIREASIRDLLLKQAPAIVTSLVVADLFYKFHSFLLETSAFLATWFVVDAVLEGARKLLRNGSSSGLSE